MSPKNITVLLYISQKLAGVDYYKVFKVMYFAEQKHLVRWGDKIIEDEFYAMPYGPVPTLTYDQIKALKSDSKISVSKELEECFKIENETIIIPLKEADLEFLSESEIECLDESIDENKDLTFYQLKHKSHKSAWTNANSGRMSSIEIAREVGASDEMLQYIEFNLDNNKPITV
jgi:uncharacterized phage-associated protein